MVPITNYPVLVRALPKATSPSVQCFTYIRTTPTFNKPKTDTEKRYNAFCKLVNEWIEEDVFIGSKNQEAICLVTHFHELYRGQLSGKPTEEFFDAESDMKSALNYFEAMMGNTFRLVK